jgi:hypothetical protein
VLLAPYIEPDVEGPVAEKLAASPTPEIRKLADCVDEF